MAKIKGVNRILIISLGGIGDTLMFTPTLKRLRESNKKSQIDALVMFSGSKKVLENTNLCDNVYFVNLYKGSKFSSFFNLLKLRKKSYDCSILAFPSYRLEYNLISFILGAKKRIAHKFNNGYVSELNFLNNTFISVDEKVHNSSNNLNLLNVFGIATNINECDLNYLFRLNKKTVSFGKEYLKKFKGKKIIALHPGSTVSEGALMKRWGYKNFVELIESINKKYGLNKVQFIVFGTDEEKSEIDGILSKCIKNVTYSNNNFMESVGILKNCDLLISNDNGFAHISAAINTPLIVLFGPTNPILCRPLGKRVKVLRKTNFKPWYRYELKRSVPKGARSGMEDIKVSDVMKEVKNA